MFLFFVRELLTFTLLMTQKMMWRSEVVTCCELYSFLLTLNEIHEHQFVKEQPAV